jgi:hypothetical protein
LNVADLAWIETDNEDRKAAVLVFKIEAIELGEFVLGLLR